MKTIILVLISLSTFAVDYPQSDFNSYRIYQTKGRSLLDKQKQNERNLEALKIKLKGVESKIEPLEDKLDLYRLKKNVRRSTTDSVRVKIRILENQADKISDDISKIKSDDYEIKKDLVEVRKKYNYYKVKLQRYYDAVKVEKEKQLVK